MSEAYTNFSDLSRKFPRMSEYFRAIRCTEMDSFSCLYALHATLIKCIPKVLIREKTTKTLYPRIMLLIWSLDFASCNSGAIVLVISNRPRATCLADLK